jgi:pyruvate,water dikinase
MKFSQLFRYWTLQVFAPSKLLRQKYASFKELLQHDKKSLELISDLEDTLHTRVPMDWARVAAMVRALIWSVSSLIRSLEDIHPGVYGELARRFSGLKASLMDAVSLPEGDSSPPYTLTMAEAAREPELAGGKAHTLSRVLQETGLPAPPGFVITTNAYHLFLAHNDLRHRLDELLAAADLDDWEHIEELSREIIAMIREGEVPAEVQEDIRRHLAQLGLPKGAGTFSLRSSAVGEDGDISYAGQYASVLQVAPEDVLAAYKEVLASKYTSRAVACRIRHGLADQETPMAVLVMEMIEARASGVVYTRDREAEGKVPKFLAVYAVPGLGHRLVDGSAEPEVHYLTREANPRIVKSISSHTSMSEFPQKTFLAPKTAKLLAKWGLRLEELAGYPQDIEWCQNNQGACYLLQARPLVYGKKSLAPAPESRGINPGDHPVLLEGGVTASPGVATGPVYVIRSAMALAEVPHGSVLVSPTLSPSLAGIIGRLRAVVAESGSRASHFASIARGARVPVLAAAPEATKSLHSGQTVTVDAGHGRVYQGDVAAFKKEVPRARLAPETPCAVRLQKILDLVSPLNLLDPTSPDFSPECCASIHDLVRFAHEKGMAEMFSLVGRNGRGLGRARQLATDLPLTLYVLDLDGSIAPEAAAKETVEPRFITSPLMRACWEGLSHPEVTWNKDLVYLDWGEFDRVSGGILSLKSALLASYAVVAQDYVHLLLRFGYHFAVLDALSGENHEANYVAFRFKGGGGSYDNRLRRVELIKTILQWAGFTVNTRGDLLDARFDRRPAAAILSRLTLLGILQGKMQLVDMALNSELQVQEMVEDFTASFEKYISDAAPT